MMRFWLLVWVISDIMIFKMNATQNSIEITTKNNKSDITTNVSFANDNKERTQIENPSIVLNLPDTNDSTSKDDKNDTTEPTKLPFIQVVINSLDQIQKDREENHTTSTTSTTTTSSTTKPPETTSVDTISNNTIASTNTTSNSTTTIDIITNSTTENPLELEKNSTTELNVTTAAPVLIPPASVKPSIKHNADTQQKIIIRYAHQTSYSKSTHKV